MSPHDVEHASFVVHVVDPGCAGVALARVATPGFLFGLDRFNLSLHLVDCRPDEDVRKDSVAVPIQPLTFGRTERGVVDSEFGE